MSFVTLTIHLCNGLNDKNLLKPRKTCFSLNNIIAEAIKGSFQNDIEELVKSVMAASVQSIVDGVVSALQARVLSLEQVNGDLVKENQRLANENEQLLRMTTPSSMAASRFKYNT